MIRTRRIPLQQEPSASPSSCPCVKSPFEIGRTKSCAVQDCERHFIREARTRKTVAFFPEMCNLAQIVSMLT